MAVAGESSKKTEWKQQAWLGELPQDFLRVAPSTNQLQEAADAQTARSLQSKYSGMVRGKATNAVGRLDITVVQAKLVKNYGLGRMDPYVRLRVGHTVYETPTCVNGARNPSWEKTIHCYIPPGISNIGVEVYDERSLTLDERIAYTEVAIPDKVLKHGETHEEWYPLSGKQGIGQEGHIQIVLTYRAVAQNQPSVPATAPVVFVPGMPGHVFVGGPTGHHGRQFAKPNPEMSQELMEEMKDMFPSMEESVIRSVFEANQGNKENTVTALLEMSA